MNDNKSWNLSLISNIFNNAKDVKDITKIYIQSPILNDKRTRLFTKNGSIYAKFAYKTISSLDTMNCNGMVKSQRIFLFGWKCLRKAILMKKRLGPKINSGSITCLICDFVEETVEHALFLCNHARAVSLALI